jgi:hypothetical protein
MSSEELIKQLCARVISAEGAEFDTALRDLQASLKAHTNDMRAMVAAALLKKKAPPYLPES